ncbi:MAG: hypothetical protein ABUL44_00525, partial [Flavobacterium sp.]
MNKQIIISFISLCSTLYIGNTVYGQASADSLVKDRMTLELKKDTLYSNTGLKFFIGQKLVIGKAAGNDGYFRAIIHKKTALVP